MVSTRRRTAALAVAAAALENETVCIVKLNDELLLHIFEILKSTSKHDLLAATVVCSKWHTLAQRVIDNHIGPISISTKMEDRNTKLFRRMKRDAGFRQRIHHFSVDEWYLREMDYHVPNVIPQIGIGENPYRTAGYFSQTWSEITRQKDPTWPQLKHLIDTVARLSLSTFTWSATPSLPRELARALSKNEHCDTQLLFSKLAEEYMKFSYAPFLNHWYNKSLGLLSGNLTSLCVVLPAADTDLLNDFGRMVWTFRKLRGLRFNAIGCLWDSTAIPYALRQTPFGKFTTVKDLNWLFGQATPGSDVLRLSTLELSNVCICADANLTTWIEHVDWNRLGSLAITCVTLFEVVCRRSHQLTSLDLTLPSGRDWEFATCTSNATMQHKISLLESLTSLRHLKLINGTDLITCSLLSAIGGGLQSLIAHERTRAGLQSETPRPLLSSSVIQHIGSVSQSLIRLAIDVPYSDIPYLSFIYDVAHAVPSIETLTVYREIEVPGTDVIDPPRSAVTNSTVQNDFLHLKEICNTLDCFEMRVTSMPPFYLDKCRHERGNAYTFLQRHLIVEYEAGSLGGEQPVLQTRNIDAERVDAALRNVASGPTSRHWEDKLSRHKFLADAAYDFYWKPPQPY